MPLEDFVSPIIKAYLAGQQIKRNREQDVLRKREADDESKIRQLNAQKLAKDIEHYDKNMELENKAKEMQFKVAQRNLTKSVLDEYEAGRIDIPEKVIEAAKMAASDPAAQNMGMTGALAATPKMGLVPEIDLGDGVKISTAGFPTRAQILARRIENQRAMLTPELEKAQAISNINDAALAKSQGRQFTQQDKTLASQQTQQSKIQEDTQAHQLSLADVNNKAALERAKVSAGATISAASMRAALSGMADPDDVKYIIEYQDDNGIFTEKNFTGMDPKLVREIKRQIALTNRRQPLSEAQDKDIQGVVKMGAIRKQFEQIIKEVGNGAATGFIPGTELYTRVNALKAELGQLARESGNVGSLSDTDIKRTEGSTPDRLGFSGLYKMNMEKLNRLDEAQLKIFNHYYPPGKVNDAQRVKIGLKLGLPMERLAYK